VKNPEKRLAAGKRHRKDGIDGDNEA